MADLLHIDIIEDTPSPVALALLEQAARLAIPHAQLTKPTLLEVTLTDNAAIQALNQDFRDKDEATDVLSFPVFQSLTEAMASPLPQVALGSIVISTEWAANHATTDDRTHAFAEPVVTFIVDRLVHGCLHVSGQHHDTDEDYATVIARQNAVLAELFGATTA